ncbi:hypothetical protein HMPREF0663_12163 [Hoylesella oralis ATCC 33269]|uniref:Uncharacterized protein n=1 Tax=Hoylesella oralis ATCC 33269 TaxID=873533 RepID=E7RS95_9BACT|nr:hypothetical protein HMPREF0663_12163 [Hoylesella oralis ATCC 33269]
MAQDATNLESDFENLEIIISLTNICYNIDNCKYLTLNIYILTYIYQGSFLCNSNKNSRAIFC